MLNNIPQWIPLAGFGLLILVIWSLFWKGLALWHSARKDNYYWFVAFLIFNTLGILEIIYLFIILKLKLNQLFSK